MLFYVLMFISCTVRTLCRVNETIVNAKGEEVSSVWWEESFLKKGM